MPYVSGGGSSGGGLGTVTSVSSANTSIAVATPTTTPALTVATIDTLFTNSPPAANLAMNSKKLTGLAAGSGAGDSLRYEQLFTAGAVPIADIADPTTGKVIGSSGGAAAAVNPPGFEIGYDQITSSVNVTGTAQATPTTIITCAAHTFDGAPVMVEFFSAQVGLSTAAGATLGIDLWEGASNLAELSFVRTLTATGQDYLTIGARWRFTPTAASHTYLLQAYTSSTTGTPFIGAGAGGTAVVPAFVRFTKV